MKGSCGVKLGFSDASICVPGNLNAAPAHSAHRATETRSGIRDAPDLRLIEPQIRFGSGSESASWEALDLLRIGHGT